MNYLKDALIPIAKFLLSPASDAPPELDILLVEDNDLDAELIALAFKNHRLHRAKSFQAAIALLGEINVDAAYVDLNIPGGHGVSVANQVIASFPSARVALVCGNPKDLEMLKPGDSLMVIVKSERMTADIRRHLLSNGNGHSQVNKLRLFVLVALVQSLTYVAGKYHLLEQIVKDMKP